MSLRRTEERLIQIITYCKFLLWRIELIFDDEAVVELMKYLDYEKLSVIFLVEMIRIGLIDKISMYIKLSMLYKKRMLDTNAFQLLRYANNQEPGNEQIVCMLADMCIQYGNIESAKKLLETIEKPGRITEVLLRKVYSDE